MSVEIIEGVTALGVGAADAAIAAKVTQKLPGNIPMSLGFELGAVLAGQFGNMFGLGREIRDPLMISGLTLLGQRSAKLAMAGKLFQPAQWGSVGGDDMGGDYTAGGGQPIQVLPGARSYGSARTAPGVRMIGPGRGGSFALYPSTTESGGVAG